MRGGEGDRQAWAAGVGRCCLGGRTLVRLELPYAAPPEPLAAAVVTVPMSWKPGAARMAWRARDARAGAGFAATRHAC